DEAVGTGTSMLAMSLAHLRIFDISKSCDLKHSILDTNALLLVRKSDDLAVVAVGDEGSASRAGPVLVQKARQHVHGNVGRCAAKELNAAEERNPQRDNGKAGIRIDRRLGHGERPRRLGGLIAWQGADVSLGGDIVFADFMGPYVEECAMAAPSQRVGDCIDVAGVPVRGRWNTRIGAPAVLVDAGDHAM